MYRRERLSSTPLTVMLLLTVTLLVAAVVLAMRGGGETGGTQRVGLAADSSQGVTVSCPSVADRLQGADIPAAAQAGVNQELANLERQIANVNARLAREPGQAGPQANDIAGKRRAVIERIILDIERVGGTAPAGLQALAECTIVGAQAGNGGNNGGGNANNGGGNANNGGNANGGNAGGAAGAQRVSCPSVEGALPAIPAQAQAEVTRSLNQLQTQIDEANARLARLAVRPEGGPNFVRNAILGPLEDKRFATLDRIQIAIGRVAARPTNLTALAACTVVDGGAANAGTNSGNAGGGNANAGGNNTNAGGAVRAQRVSCPVVTPSLPAVPASARAEVDRNLALLRKQIDDANARLARLAVRPEGGPNFVRNAILGPLEDKRFATLNRIEISIGRTAARPNALSDLAPCRVVG
jgi:hypothetical protein